MSHRGVILAGVATMALMGSGTVDADAWLDRPQDAVPSTAPVSDGSRQIQSKTDAQPPEEFAPNATSDPIEPVPGKPPALVADTRPDGKLDPVAERDADVEIIAVTPGSDEPLVPTHRQRRPVAVIQAIDKVTAETMRFEVEVGGPPVRFNNTLIFKVRACELSAPDELTADAVAYMDVSLQPRGTLPGIEPRQIFRGWMFASSPAVSGLQHPVYDAWVVGCKG